MAIVCGGSVLCLTWYCFHCLARCIPWYVPTNNIYIHLFPRAPIDSVKSSRSTRMSSGGTSMVTTSITLGWTMRASTTTSCRGWRSVCVDCWLHCCDGTQNASISGMKGRLAFEHDICFALRPIPRLPFPAPRPCWPP